MTRNQNKITNSTAEELVGLDFPAITLDGQLHTQENGYLCGEPDCQCAEAKNASATARLRIVRETQAYSRLYQAVMGQPGLEVVRSNEELQAAAARAAQRQPGEIAAALIISKPRR